MNAKEAKQLAIQSKDIVGYVENEISEDVRNLAEMGEFDGQVYVHTPDWSDNLREFIRMTEVSLKKLGYDVVDTSIRGGGVTYTISWEKVNMDITDIINRKLYKKEISK